MPGDELTDVVGNQEYGFSLDARARDWLRRGVSVALFDSLERPESGDALTFQLRQVQQYAAFLPPGLRCQCRSNGRSMPLALHHWPCCPMFARLPPPAIFSEEALVDPWTLPEDQ